MRRIVAAHWRDGEDYEANRARTGVDQSLETFAEAKGRKQWSL